jgi:hypothetical protein
MVKGSTVAAGGAAVIGISILAWFLTRKKTGGGISPILGPGPTAGQGGTAAPTPSPSPYSGPAPMGPVVIIVPAPSPSPFKGYGPGVSIGPSVPYSP